MLAAPVPALASRSGDGPPPWRKRLRRRLTEGGAWVLTQMCAAFVFCVGGLSSSVAAPTFFRSRPSICSEDLVCASSLSSTLWGSCCRFYSFLGVNSRGAIVSTVTCSRDVHGPLCDAPPQHRCRPPPFKWHSSPASATVLIDNNDLWTSALMSIPPPRSRSSRPSRPRPSPCAGCRIF